MASGGAPVRYKGSNFLRQLLVLATVSGRPVTITDIRVHDEEPGLRDFEASFVRLLDKICDGFGDSSSACAALVTQIKADFETQQTARKTFDENKDKEAEWFEEKDPTRPGIAEHATTFCTELWGLLAMPSM